MRRGTRGAVALLSVLALAVPALVAGQPAPAHADGDPASDVLLVQNVFYPYQPKVSPSLERALEGAIASLGRASGVHVKVAIIRTAPELGLVPQYFGHAQAYARFLDREISFNAPQTLITVMPAGFGAMPERYATALASLPVDAGAGSDGLTRAAISAVVALSRYLGHPITPPAVTSTAPSGSSSPTLAFALPVALLVAAGLLLLGRHRLRSARRPRGG